MTVRRIIRKFIRGTEIVVFGNCQGRALVKYLQRGLEGGRYRIRHFRNNPRTGKMKSPEVIMDALLSADIAIVQPLKDKHGILSYRNLKNTVSGKTVLIAVPYVVNTGVYSLCYNPHNRSKFDYGRIHGEEIIVQELEQHGVDGVIKRYERGEVDFRLKERFAESVDILRKKEELTDVVVSDFLCENYQERKLFLTCNHPYSLVFMYILDRIKAITGLPIRMECQEFKEENFARLPAKHALISPYDIEVHGYKFDPTPDWFEKGATWIKMIAEAYTKSLPCRK